MVLSSYTEASPRDALEAMQHGAKITENVRDFQIYTSPPTPTTIQIRSAMYQYTQKRAHYAPNAKIPNRRTILHLRTSGFGNVNLFNIAPPRSLSTVLFRRGFPTGRVQSYAGKTHFLDCRSTPAPRKVQIWSAFATRTYDTPGYYLHWKPRSSIPHRGLSRKDHIQD